MIEHVRLRIESKDLKMLLNEKAGYHKKQARNLSDQLISLNKVADIRQEIWQDQIAAVIQKREEETKRAIYFEFCSKYIIHPETYELYEADLKLLGLV